MGSNQGPTGDGTLRKFFAGMSEYVFYSHLGLADVEIIDYISDLLVRFTKTESMHRVRQLNGKPAVEVVSMMAEAQHRVGVAKREVHRHIGDFTLFWSGMYPEALRELQGPDRKDQFLSYCAQGKKAYGIASEIEADRPTPNCSLLKRLSSHFEMCAYGLREIRREFERGEDGNERERPIIIL